MHQLSLAGGALLTYAWHGFQAPLLMPATPPVKLAGNLVFALSAVLLLAATAWRLKHNKIEAVPMRSITPHEAEAP